MSGQNCNACNGTSFIEVLNLGQTPIAHRYLHENIPNNDYTHLLSISFCCDCGLIQILNPIPPEELYKDYNYCFSDWKPQPHVDQEINLIEEHIQKDNLVFEVGCNDGMFLNQMKGRGFIRLIGVEPNQICFQRATERGLHIYNEFFDAAIAKNIVREHGKVDVIVIRQVMEHIEDLQELLKNFRLLLNPKGWLLIEVPDLERALKFGDCSALWEEHANYFAESTMINLLEKNGFSIKKVSRFPFSGGALMVWGQHSNSDNCNLDIKYRGF